MSPRILTPAALQRIVARIAPAFPRAEVYAPLASNVRRVAAGDFAESHPLDAAILAELRRKRSPR